MKNKENYCKFVIQFNSIPKIISLIVLLFILLFSISCKSKQKPNDNTKYLELVGSWGTKDNYPSDVYIFSDGSLILLNNWNAIVGKVADTFDSYPHTIKLRGTNQDGANKNDAGTVTFYSATNLYFSFDFNGSKKEDNFYKYSDKLITDDGEVDKNYFKWRWVNW